MHQLCHNRPLDYNIFLRKKIAYLLCICLPEFDKDIRIHQYFQIMLLLRSAMTTSLSMSIFPLEQKNSFLFLSVVIFSVWSAFKESIKSNISAFPANTDSLSSSSCSPQPHYPCLWPLYFLFPFFTFTLCLVAFYFEFGNKLYLILVYQFQKYLYPFFCHHVNFMVGFLLKCYFFLIPFLLSTQYLSPDGQGSSERSTSPL